jgi:hypothetical protein
MRLVFRILALLVLAPVVLVILIVGAAAAVAGLPLLWEALIRAYTAPPNAPGETS